MISRDFIPFHKAERASKQISYKDLSEAIIEREFYPGDHDNDYLASRIHLIATNLGIEFHDSPDSYDPFLQPLKDLISGATRLTTHSLPEDRWVILEGVPDTPDYKAYDVVRREMKEEYESVKVGLEAINEMYVTHLIYFSIPKEKRDRTFPISDLWLAGLPKTEPYPDYDNW